MFNLGYFKGQPTEYVLKYSRGRLASEGQGLAFFYFRFNTQVLAVPTSSVDSNFVFNEVTRNFQAVTIQGQFTYRITNPQDAAKLLNFTIDPRTRSYLSNDPDKLAQRITNIIQMDTRGELQRLSLEEALGSYESIAQKVEQHVKASASLNSLGVELLSIYFIAAKPTPEVAQALEAEYRESLLRKADEAIYARRAAAVEEEGKIKEKELNSDITLEEQRKQLIDLKGENDLTEAENRGKALEIEAKHRIDSKKLELALYGGLDPKTVLALALNEIGMNAERIGNLTITSEMLSSLLNGQGASLKSES
jgi:regulator of protease activity HflC (stomatin/prohibitin superfamily)